MKKKQIPAYIALLVICVVAAALLATINGVTKGPIDEQQKKNLENACKQMLPQAVTFEENRVDDFVYYKGIDGENNPVGFVAINTVMGFGGEIELVVGADPDGCITGLQVGGANFSETAGLGAKTKEAAFTDQFAGKTYPLDLKKNGGEIDAVTAATISSSAVVRGVNDALSKLGDEGCIKIAKPAVAVEELGNNKYATTMQGFGGPVYVELEIKDGIIESIVIGDENFNETSGFGAKAKDESFWKQYIGKSGTNLALGSDIDAVSGATITSTAVNDAVNMILLYVNDRDAFDAMMSAKQDVPSEFADGEYVVEASGVESTFKVTVTIKDNVVESVKIGDTEPDSSDNYFLPNCQNDTFQGQFVGKTYPIEDVDIASGATVSSKAVLKAVNAAFEMAGNSGSSAPTEFEDGEYVVEASGVESTFKVTVTIKDNVVESVKISDTEPDSSDNYFLPNCQNDTFQGQFVGKTYPIEDVDIASGATVSSKAVLKAVNTAFEMAGNSGSSAPTEFEDGEYVVEASGVESTFKVTVTIKDNVVESVKIGDTEPDSSDNYFLPNCQNDTFQGQFVGKTYPIEDVDIASGATVSSKAVLKAVNAAFEEAAK